MRRLLEHVEHQRRGYHDHLDTDEHNRRGRQAEEAGPSQASSQGSPCAGARSGAGDDNRGAATATARTGADHHHARCAASASTASACATDDDAQHRHTGADGRYPAAQRRRR
jgi:hypothetical protein